MTDIPKKPIKEENNDLVGLLEAKKEEKYAKNQISLDLEKWERDLQRSRVSQ